MALVTTFMTTPLLRWICPPEELAKDQVPLPPVALPAGQVPFTVLMCVSHGQAGIGMVTLGRALTGVPNEPFQLFALHLERPTGRISAHRRREQEGNGGNALAPLLGQASTLGLEVRPLSFVSVEPGLDICRTAAAKQAQLILLGLHKPLFSRTMLGGTVHEVMQEANSDVAVLVDRGLKEVRRVLVPFIGSAHDWAALSLARRLLRAVGAELTVLHVTAPEHGQSEPNARAAVETLFSGESAGRVHFKAVAHGSPEDAALEEAKQGYDLVVVGVGSEWGLEDSLFGLQRERLIGDAPTSLLVIRHPRSERAAERADKPGTAPGLPAKDAV